MNSDSNITAHLALEAVTPMHTEILSAMKSLVPLMWPHHASTMLPWEAVEEFLSANGSGAIYGILDRARTVVGMTGWYWRPENPTNAGLRWTGIAPDARRCGYFRAAITMVHQQVARAKPDVQSLSAIIPAHRADELLPIFVRLGFEEVPDFMEERSPRVQGNDYLADGIFVTKEMDTSRPKISELLRRSPIVADMFTQNPLSTEWAKRTIVVSGSDGPTSAAGATGFPS